MSAAARRLADPTRALTTGRVTIRALLIRAASASAAVCL